jgi:predicted MPP superfamily phosphohydrolase
LWGHPGATVRDNGAVSVLLKTLGGAVGVGASALAYAALIERNWFALREASVPVLPPGSSPVRILQVSDLHLTPGQERKIGWVRALANLQPDFVINSGDNLSHLEAVPGLLRAMEPLLEFPGAFVLGSNDYYAPVLKNPALYLTSRYARVEHERPLLPTQSLVDGLTGGGWRDLNNARSRVSVAGVPLEFVGVNDPHIELDRYAAVAGPAAEDVALTIGLVHAPYQRVLDAMVADGAGLVIAGHTHGGQLRVPGYGALVTNCDLDRRRASGLSRWWPGAGGAGSAGGAQAPYVGDPRAVAPSSQAPPDAAWLHVSAGLGTSRFAPVRFACRPEATLLTLVATES